MRLVGLFSLREWILRLREAKICPRLPGWEVAASKFASWSDSSRGVARGKDGRLAPGTGPRSSTVSDGESAAMGTEQSRAPSAPAQCAGP